MIARPAKGKKEKKNQDIGGTKMTINKTKKKLIEENKQLKIKAQEQERRVLRLKARINNLQKVAALGRHGVP